jgi:hypothetical protein
MRNSIIALGTLGLLAMIVPMLALPVFAVVGANSGIGADDPKVGTGQNGGSNVVSHSPGGQHQIHNGANAPNSDHNGANAPRGTCGAACDTG